MGRAFLSLCFGVVLVFLGATTDVAAPAPKPKTYFLVIGVDNKAKETDTFAAETEYLRNALVEKLTNVEERVYLRSEATRANCIKGLDWISQVPTDDDTAIIYIGTHGRDDEQGFSFRAFDERVRSQEVIVRLSKLHCKTLLMVDTCKAGAMVRDWKCANNVSILACCEATQFARCWKFTVCFVSALTDADYDNNGFVDLNEVKTFLPIKMKEIGCEQNLVYSKTDLNLVLANIK